MIKAKGGEITFRGTRSNVMAEAVTVLRALKEEQVKDEAEIAREMLKK
jgi:hypothetical protein